MQNLQISISIAIAGAIVVSAVVFSGEVSGISAVETDGNHFGNSNSVVAKNVRPIDSGVDHILGSVDAKVIIIEYSDFECSFCSQFHPTLERVIEDFDGEVAWVYRHFPITSIHSKATGAAVASECVAELGGNDSFWKFTAKAFQNQRNFGTEFYTDTAVGLGISESNFTACINSGRYDERIQQDFNNAILSGGRGTPFTVVIDKDGEVFTFRGALPYESVRSIAEQALKVNNI